MRSLADALEGARRIVAGFVLLWRGLVVVLWLNRRSETTARDLVRVLPDTVRLVSRLGRDGTLPWGVRIRLWLEQLSPLIRGAGSGGGGR
jgi:hypothetical protein